MLGALLPAIFTGGLSEFTAERIPFWFTIIANPLCWLCIWLLWRKARKAVAIQSGDSRLRFLSLAMRGLPLTDRIALLVFSTLWVAGFVGGLILPLFDPTFAR